MPTTVGMAGIAHEPVHAVGSCCGGGGGMGHIAGYQEAQRRLAVAPAAGLGRVVGTVTEVADALGHHVEAGLVDRDDH